MTTRFRIAVLALLALLTLTGQSGTLAGARLPAAPATAAPAAPAPGDWPMFGHDAQRTGFNPAETTISAGNLNQLVQRWQVNVGTNGTPTSAAPSVVGGRVYVASSAAAPADNFFVFDAMTGAPVWHENIGYRSSCFNVGIGSTPAISGTMVVVGADSASANPAYYGLNAISGTSVWTNTLSVGASGFPWESPLIAGNRTYVGVASRCDNPSVRGELRALDVNTGALLANAYFVNPGGAGGGIWNSPALSPDGNTIFVGTGEDYNCTDCSLTRSMVSLNATTLAILQHHQEPSPNNDQDFGTTPVVFHDSQGRTLVGANHKNGTFYAYDVANITAGAVWTRAIGTSVGSSPAYDPSFGSGGTLFAQGGGAQLYALDPGTGANRWAGASVTVSYQGNIAIANGLLFINQGNSVQIRSEATGALLRTLTPQNPGATNSGIAVSNGFIYWLGGSYINAWSFPPGTPTATPSAGPTGTPVPASATPPPPTATRTSPPTGTLVPPSITGTPAPSNTVGPTSTGQPSSTVAPTGTAVPPSSATATPTRTSGVATRTPGATSTPGGTSTPGATSTPCVVNFTDVHPTDYFYVPVQYLACHGVVSGYGDGTFRPYNNTTRSQMVKIVVLGFNRPIVTPPAGAQTFTDVPPSNPFFSVVETAAAANIVSGYGCGGPGEPCDPQNRPYFRPFANVTRGQLAKITVVAAGWTLQNPASATFADVQPNTTFYTFVETAYCHGVISGYSCGGVGEPCDPQNRPYFRQFNDATRGQISKIVYNAITSSGGCASLSP